MYIEIDGNTRKINITQEQRLFGVVQDCNAERKYFKMPRIVGNNIDVTNCIIYIVYQKSDEVGNIYYGEPNMYMCEDVVLDETEQNVTFSWELTKDIFDISGYLGFKILVKCTDDDGNVKNVWNTIPEFGIICKSMFGDKIHIQEQNKDIVSKLLQDLKQIKNEMKTKITQPSTAQVGQIFRVQAINEDGTFVLETVDMPSGGSGGGGIHLISRVVTESDAASIEVTGLSTTAESLSLRIYNLGSSCGNGLTITVNGVKKSGYTGTMSGGSVEQALVRAWLYRDNGILHGRAIMANLGINLYEWFDPGEITSIVIASPYNDGTTKYFQTGTIFEIYEGVYPNVV